MKRANILHLLLEILVIVGNLILGVTVLTYMMQGIPLTRFFIGVIVFAIGLFELTDFFTLKYAIKMRSIQSMIAAVIEIALGIVFMAVRMDSKLVCILWGSISIATSIIIIVTAGLNVSSQTLINVVKIIIEIIEIVFCILLIVRTLDSLGEHMIFTGIALIVEAVTLLIEFFMNRYQR